MAELTPNQCQFTFSTAISPNIPVSVSLYNFQTSIFGMGPPGYEIPSMYANPTIGLYDQAQGSQAYKQPGVCSPLKHTMTLATHNQSYRIHREEQGHQVLLTSVTMIAPLPTLWILSPHILSQLVLLKVLNQLKF